MKFSFFAVLILLGAVGPSFADEKPFVDPFDDPNFTIRSQVTDPAILSELEGASRDGTTTRPATSLHKGLHAKTDIYLSMILLGMFQGVQDQLAHDGREGQLEGKFSFERMLEAADRRFSYSEMYEELSYGELYERVGTLLRDLAVCK